MGTLAESVLQVVLAGDCLKILMHGRVSLALLSQILM